MAFSSLATGCGEAEFSQFPLAEDWERDASPFYTELEIDAGLTALDEHDDSPPAPDLLPAGDPLCADLADCLAQCDTLRCDDGCYDAAPADTAARHTAYANCGVQHACSEPGGSFHEGCIADYCAAERTSCFGQGPVAQPGEIVGSGDLTCAMFVTCLDECPSNDGDCEDDCRRASRPGVSAEYNAARECIDSCPEDDYACQVRECSGEMTPCFGTQLPAPTGTGTCSGLNHCVLGCAPGNQACLGACHREAAPSGYNAYFALDDCTTASQCPEDNARCVQLACPDEWDQCHLGASIPGGANEVDGTCAELDSCMSACGGVLACESTCQDAASLDAIGRWTTANTCRERSGCDGNAGCLTQACGLLIDACLADAAPGGVGGNAGGVAPNNDGQGGDVDGPPFPVLEPSDGVSPTGQMICSEFGVCLQRCEGQRACAHGCITSASPEAFNRYTAISNCQRNNRCEAGSDPNCCQNEIVRCGGHQ